jgi:hypothetical protein
MKRLMSGFIVLILAALGTAGMARLGTPTTAPAAPPANMVRIGTYDSRAVAVAFGRSGLWKQQLAAKMDEQRQAKAAGDKKKLDELEAWGAAEQRRLHRQGFSTEPVDNILKQIADELPQVANDIRVVAIVRQADWRDDGQVELIDVTDRLVQCFNPDEKTQKIIADLRARPPVDLDALEGHANR